MARVWVNAEIFTGSEKINKGFIRFNQSILDCGPMNDYRKQDKDQETDVQGKLVIPGFIDVHSHGGYGVDTMDANPEALNWMVQRMVEEEGITSYFPTTMTQSASNIEAALKAVREASRTNAVIQGIHLEGPFISTAFKGAQPEEYIQKPNAEMLDRWHHLSGRLIRLVTYAPEEEGASDFEAYCKENGIILSMGHTNATREELRQSSATHAAHLYNAQRGLHHREPGVTGHVFLEEKISAEMIVDGFHISPDMVNLAYRLKGPRKIELITDAMRAKGMPEGTSELGGQTVVVKDKQARLKEGNLAGSVLTFPDAFRNMIDFTGCSIEDAVYMSSVNQAKEFGLQNKGGIHPGFDADFLCLNRELELQMTVSMGNVFRPKTFTKKG